MSIAASDFPAPLLTPHGHLLLVPDSDAPSLPAARARRLTDAFASGSDAKDLVMRAGAGLPKSKHATPSGRVLDDPHLADVFGIEMAEIAPAMIPAARRRKSTAAKASKAPAAAAITTTRKASTTGKPRATKQPAAAQMPAKGKTVAKPAARSRKSATGKESANSGEVDR